MMKETPMPRKFKLGLSIMFFVLGGVALLITMFFTLAGLLASQGILADVGPAENQEMARQAFTVTAQAGLVSVVLFVFAFVALHYFRKHPK